MSRTPFTTTLRACCLLLAHGPARGESSVGSQSASASLRIQVIVAPWVRILRNDHPAALPTQGGEPVTAEQQLTISTNQPRGFCLDLVPAATAANLGWQLQAVSGAGVTFTPQGEGYRLCAPRHGTYPLTLTHRFQPQPAGHAPAWPLLAQLAQP
jgi:hypothetical protein